MSRARRCGSARTSAVSRQAPQGTPASLRDVSSAKMAALRVGPTRITRMVSPTVAALDPVFLPPLPLRAGEHVANVSDLVLLPRSTPLRVFDEAFDDAADDDDRHGVDPITSGQLRIAADALRERSETAPSEHSRRMAEAAAAAGQVRPDGSRATTRLSSRRDRETSK